ncbi:TetR/AcrR family transcriptional regulator [Paenibacillus psychroresistens]|uniref:TetR/AcrR family transcriptional regulator n=1 Tax=Paenibacillus psychroresistens TaxID=1778678 RepID=A0A6B8RP23_9BACL|nr:TetR family transcriptional regulator [Paenibacillus psychroresistens]QGQ97253.1 TetR/AcrR family transcriptional regulator [Paenibacillus psychroresistens]
MADFPLSKEIILDKAEEVLRRFGPAKANLLDVARALNVSHAAIYKYYSSKTALRDAVTERWLDRITEPMNAIISLNLPPEVKLFQLVEHLIKSKQQSSLADPEMFATYATLASEAREVLELHLTHIVDLLTLTIEHGITAGTFNGIEPRETAQAILIATSRFHHPSHAQDWLNPEIHYSFNVVWNLLMKGLTQRS